MSDAEARRHQRKFLMMGLGPEALCTYLPFIDQAVQSAVEEWVERGAMELRSDGRGLTPGIVVLVVVRGWGAQPHRSAE